MRFLTTLLLLTAVQNIFAADPPAAESQAKLKLTAPIIFTEEAKSLAGKRIAVLGDSITQGGGYISFLSYYLEKLHPNQEFDIYPLGLASETLSGLSEDGHAGGAFPRPWLFERLGRVLEKVKPEVVFACYGMNDGIYQPLDEPRFTAFKAGVLRLITDCRAAKVQSIYIVTPPIYDAPEKAGEFHYDAVLTSFAAWERTLREEGVKVIDLHTAMQKARTARMEPFSKDHIHPGDDGHLFMAHTIVEALGIGLPEANLAEIKADPLFKECDRLRRLRADGWMRHTGYTREKVVTPQPLGNTETEAAAIRTTINSLRRKSCPATSDQDS